MSISISSHLPRAMNSPTAPPPGPSQATRRLGSSPPACVHPETPHEISICGQLEKDEARQDAERRKLDNQFFESLEKHWPF